MNKAISASGSKIRVLERRFDASGVAEALLDASRPAAQDAPNSGAAESVASWVNEGGAGGEVKR
jgi:hypothetical protein